MRGQYELADVIRLFKDDFFANFPPCPQVSKVLYAIAHCRTAVLGGHVDECPECGHMKISYNSCRNRHCPKCQGIEREKWIQDRKQELLPVKYFHVVFTLPHTLNGLLSANMKEGYGALFHAANATLEKFARTAGFTPAMTAVLHTWGSNLSYHPHLHCIVPAGGIGQDGKWMHAANAFNKSPFLFSVRAMSKVFRAIFVERFTKMVQIPQKVRKELFSKEWIVYSKHPFKKPEHVIEYLGRYSHRVAISNRRIEDISHQKVTFQCKDYRQGGKKLLITLTGVEFLRRFCFHILPCGFVRIRHYGFLAAANREKLGKLQQQAGVPVIPKRRRKRKWLEIARENGKEYGVCPLCKEAIMRTIATIPMARAPPKERFRINKNMIKE